MMKRRQSQGCQSLRLAQTAQEAPADGSPDLWSWQTPEQAARFLHISAVGELIVSQLSHLAFACRACSYHLCGDVSRRESYGSE